jgi:hypothetical protein
MSPLLRRAPVAATLAAAVLLAACGSSDDDTAGTTGTVAAGASSAAAAAEPATGGVPPELLGTYERRVTAADIARTDVRRRESGGQERPEPAPGRLQITAGALRFTALEEPSPLVIRQNVEATAGRLEIKGYVRPDVGAFCGPEIPQNASYTWRVEGGSLVLKAIDDPCADRDSSLTGRWARKG